MDKHKRMLCHLGYQCSHSLFNRQKLNLYIVGYEWATATFKWRLLSFLSHARGHQEAKESVANLKTKRVWATVQFLKFATDFRHLAATSFLQTVSPCCSAAVDPAGPARRQLRGEEGAQGRAALRRLGQPRPHHHVDESGEC